FLANYEAGEFVSAAFAEMVVLVADFLVVEVDPEFFLVLGRLNFERLAGRDASDRAGGLGLEEQGVGVCRVGREGERRLFAGASGFTISLGAVDVFPRLIAVAAVNQAAGPDADRVAFQ